MAQKLRWHPEAVNDLEAICRYIAKDSQNYAILFAEKIFSIAERISRFPLSGRIVPEYKQKNIREIIYGNYRVVYRIKNDIIEIATITHGARIMKL